MQMIMSCFTITVIHSVKHTDTHTCVGHCTIFRFSECETVDCGMSYTHSCLGRHIHARRREFTLTQILFSQRPLPKFGKQMWKQERRGRWGRGAVWEVDQTSGSSERHYAACTFFSLYNTNSLSLYVCVCVCVLDQIRLTSFSRLSLKCPFIPPLNLTEERKELVIVSTKIRQKIKESVTFWLLYVPRCMFGKRSKSDHASAWTHLPLCVYVHLPKASQQAGRPALYGDTQSFRLWLLLMVKDFMSL